MGFSRTSDRSGWTVSTSFELVFLIVLQGFTFIYEIYLVIQAVHERRTYSETSSDYDDASLRISSGTWTAVGAKIGVIEVLLGFVDGGFPVVFTRRILRMLSRICVYIGVSKSYAWLLLLCLYTVSHTYSPFSSAQMQFQDGRSHQSSSIRDMISAPRGATFARLSANASSFYALPRARGAGPADAFATGNGYGTRDMAGRRVTIQYDGQAAPTLNLRLSDLNMPHPEVFSNSYEQRSGLLAVPRAPSTRRNMSEGSSASLPSQMANSYQTGGQSSVSRGTSRASIGRMPLASYNRSDRVRSGDSLDAVNQLAERFPGIPPRVTTRNLAILSESQMSERQTFASRLATRNHDLFYSRPPSDEEAISRTDSKSGSMKSSQGSHKSNPSSGSLRRKAVPLPPPIDSSIARSTVKASATSETPATSPLDSPVGRGRRTTSSTPGLTTTQTTAESPMSGDPFRDGGIVYRESELYNPGRGLGTIAARVVEFEERRRKNSQPEINPFGMERQGSLRPPSPGEISINSVASWIDQGATTIEAVRREQLSGVQPGMSRIKSIGVVSTRQTPTPTSSEFVRRQSMKVEGGDIGDIPTNMSSARTSLMLGGIAEERMSYDKARRERRTNSPRD